MSVDVFRAPADDATNRAGALAMVSAMALFVLNDSLVKLATATYPTGQVLALRGAFAVLCSLVLVRALGSWSDLRALTNRYVLLRGLTEGVVAATFIAALAHLPLANITAILQAASLITVALAALLRIERVGWRRWLAVVVGFAGVILMLRPSAAGLNAHALLALFSATLVGARDLLTRRIGSAIPSTTVAVGTTVFVMLTGVALAPFETWVALETRPTLYLMAAAAFVLLGNYFIIAAFRKADVSLVSAFRYTVLVFALVMGVLVWGDWPDGLSLLGSALIVGSGLYALHRQRVRRSPLDGIPPGPGPA
jgi:drug/metabolite transporter (DMT)-like permease